MEAYKKEQMKQEIEDAITDDSGQIELDTITDVLFTLVKKMVQLHSRFRSSDITPRFMVYCKHTIPMKLELTDRTKLRGRPKKDPIYETPKKRELYEGEDPDWHFDFTMYEEEQEVFKENKAYEKPEDYKPASVLGVRSRWDNSIRELQRMADLGDNIAKASIEIEARTADAQLLWRYYGILAELWECMRPIHGGVVQKFMDERFQYARVKLYAIKKGEEVQGIHEALLMIRKELYKYRQFANLGFSVESRSVSGALNKVERKIVE
jgi:hypothetical protein